MSTPPALDLFDALSADGATSLKDPNTLYWWKTTGRDLAAMLHSGSYPQTSQRNFLTFHRDILCPRLGTAPTASSAKSGVGKHGDCFEYSLEFKSTSAISGVRFGLDLSPLRPIDAVCPLSTTSQEEVIALVGKQVPNFGGDTWYHALRKWFVYSHVPQAEQEALIAQAGHRMHLCLAFDIHKGELLAPDALPVMAKVYFPPCFVAAAKGLTRWEAVRMGIRQLPGVEAYPNILRGLGVIEAYMAGLPREFEHGVRYLATDFLAPEKTRIKIYARYPGPDFEGIWDFYTLGGRIEELEGDKEKFRELMELMSDYESEPTKEPTKPKMKVVDADELAMVGKKATTLYFSLTAENPGPAPKVGFYPANTANNDLVIAKGLDKWLKKYGWYDGGKTLVERLNDIFTHRKLEEKTGIFTFIDIGRKEHPTRKDISIQVYTTPELYNNPRF